MPKGDKTKELAFAMWLAGQSLEEIQREICRNSGTLLSSVKGWILDWERGRQRKWSPELRK